MGLRSSRVDELVDAVNEESIHEAGARGPWAHLYDPAKASAGRRALMADSTPAERNAAVVRVITGDTEAAAPARGRGRRR